MSNTTRTETVDIYEHPPEILNHKGSITIGDLHGNALKLLHFLILFGVVKAYTKHNQKRRVFFSFKHRHGPDGRKRACDFQTAMLEKETFDDVIFYALTHLTQKKGNLHAHSFKPMLLKTLAEVTNECKETNLTVNVTSEYFYRQVTALANAYGIALEVPSTINKFLFE